MHFYNGYFELDFKKIENITPQFSSFFISKT